jgi:hypothetical protein
MRLSAWNIPTSGKVTIDTNLGGTIAAVTLAVTLVCASSLADNEAAKVTADKVRAQGFPCAEPVSAERDPAASKPDEEVWILECKDARYRVRLMQDMPAKVERLQ